MLLLVNLAVLLLGFGTLVIALFGSSDANTAVNNGSTVAPNFTTRLIGRADKPFL